MARPVQTATRRVTFVLPAMWVHVILRGVLMLGLGLMALLRPRPFSTLLYVFGIVAVLDGLLAALIVNAGRTLTRLSWLLLPLALFVTAVGVAVLWRSPEMEAPAVLPGLAAWAAARGLLDLGVAAQLRAEKRRLREEAGLVMTRGMKGGSLLALGGVASLVFGAGVIVPSSPDLPLLTVRLACLASTLGLLLVIVGLRMRVKIDPDIERINFINIR